MSASPTVLLALAALATIAHARGTAAIEAQPRPGITLAQVRRAQERLTVGTIRDLDGNDILIQCKGDADCVASQGSRSVRVEVVLGTDTQGVVTRLEVDRATITGNYHKGPFLAGSQVRAWPLDAVGRSLGPTDATLTSDDWGSYRLSTWAAGPLLVEGRGRYWDEAAGAVSDEPLTLRAILPTPDAPAHVNAFTHVAAARALRLLAAGMSPADAVARADAELARSLDLDGVSPGGAMSLWGAQGDILFAWSTRVTAAARTGGGSGDGAAPLQACLDRMAADLADDGRLDAPPPQVAPEDLERAKAAFAARFPR